MILRALVVPLVFTLLVAATHAADARAADPKPTRDERLASGEILVWRDTKDKELVLLNAVIDAPPEAVWAIVFDCGNYAKTMKGIKESKQVKDDGPNRVCTVTADLPFPLPDLTSTTNSVNVAEPGKLYTRTWKLIEGDYTRNEGQWKLEPFGADGKRTLVSYRIAVVPKIPVPDSVATSMQQSKLPDMIKHLRTVVATKK
jgi:ribosome-associated toxin RatA of RatAB toxin-antitoxin module